MREPNFTRLVELCDVLDVTSDYLLGRTPAPPPGSERARVATEEPIPEGQDNTDEEMILQWLQTGEDLNAK